MCSDSKFDKLYEQLSERIWVSRDGEMEIEDMEPSHIRRVIRMIERGDVDLCGLENDYIAMFAEELDDRGEEVEEDDDDSVD